MGFINRRVDLTKERVVLSEVACGVDQTMRGPDAGARDVERGAAWG